MIARWALLLSAAALAGCAAAPKRHGAEARAQAPAARTQPEREAHTSVAPLGSAIVLEPGQRELVLQEIEVTQAAPDPRRPQRKFVGARAQEFHFADYIEQWRKRCERLGNLNYGVEMSQGKLRGSAQLTVAIRADGSIESLEINRSSGDARVDKVLLKIIETAAPFAPLPPAITRDTDILHITRTWTIGFGP
jgi:periplasmic protein TonB